MGFHLFLHGWWCSCSVFFLFIICIIVVNLWTLCTLYICTKSVYIMYSSVHNIFVKPGKIWSKTFIKRTQINHPFSRKFFFCTIYILNTNKIKYINNVLMVYVFYFPIIWQTEKVVSVPLVTLLGIYINIHN